MMTTLPWDYLWSSQTTASVTRTPDGGTCPAAEDCRCEADQDNQRGIFKVRAPLHPFMSDTFTDEVLYLTALLREDQSLVVPRLSGIIPDCGAWIRSRSYIEPGTARFFFEFPPATCVGISSGV